MGDKYYNYIFVRAETFVHESTDVCWWLMFMLMDLFYNIIDDFICCWCWAESLFNKGYKWNSSSVFSVL